MRASGLLTLIKNEINNNTDENIANRRYIHMHPEIGFDTKGTEDFVRSKLEEIGVEIIPSSIGVVGLIKGADSDKIIALRADMDALCLQEENDVEYKSLFKNKMHACGHDAHTAILLGTAKIAYQYREQLPCDLMMIFQPAEEGPALGGARIIQSELDERGLTPKIKYMYGLHVFNDYDIGTIAIKYGNMMASTDEFEIKIIGKGGHAGQPHMAVDALSITTKIVNSVESFISRRVDPFDQAVCSFGIMQSGTAKNIIAETGILQGTIRCQKEATREFIIKKLDQIVSNTCAAFDATSYVNIIHGLPVLLNDQEATKYAEDVIGRDMPDNKLIKLDTAVMGAEDFAYYSRKIPSSFIFIGSRNAEKGFVNLAHQPRFDIDEDAINIGIEVFCSLIFDIQL